MMVINIGCSKSQIKLHRKNIEDYFRKVAKEHNDKHFPVKLEDIVDKDDKGKKNIICYAGFI